MARPDTSSEGEGLVTEVLERLCDARTARTSWARARVMKCPGRCRGADAAVVDGDDPEVASQPVGHRLPIPVADPDALDQHQRLL